MSSATTKAAAKVESSTSRRRFGPGRTSIDWVHGDESGELVLELDMPDKHPANEACPGLCNVSTTLARRRLTLGLCLSYRPRVRAATVVFWVLACVTACRPLPSRAGAGPVDVAISQTEDQPHPATNAHEPTVQADPASPQATSDGDDQAAEAACAHANAVLELSLEVKLPFVGCRMVAEADEPDTHVALFFIDVQEPESPDYEAFVLLLLTTGGLDVPFDLSYAFAKRGLVRSNDVTYSLGTPVIENELLLVTVAADERGVVERNDTTVVCKIAAHECVVE